MTKGNLSGRRIPPQIYLLETFAGLFIIYFPLPTVHQMNLSLRGSCWLLSRAWSKRHVLLNKPKMTGRRQDNFKQLAIMGQLWIHEVGFDQNSHLHAGGGEGCCEARGKKDSVTCLCITIRRGQLLTIYWLFSFPRITRRRKLKLGVVMKISNGLVLVRPYKWDNIGFKHLFSTVGKWWIFITIGGSCSTCFEIL